MSGEGQHKVFTWKDKDGNLQTSTTPPTERVTYEADTFNADGQLITRRKWTPEDVDRANEAQKKRDEELKKRSDAYECKRQVAQDQREVNAATKDVNRAVSKYNIANDARNTSLGGLQDGISTYNQLRGYGHFATVLIKGVLLTSKGFGSIGVGVGNDLLGGETPLGAAGDAIPGAASELGELAAEAGKIPHLAGELGSLGGKIYDVNSALNSAEQFPDLIELNGTSAEELAKFSSNIRNLNPNLSEVVTSGKPGSAARDLSEKAHQAQLDTENRDDAKKQVKHEKDRREKIAEELRAKESQGLCVDRVTVPSS